MCVCKCVCTRTIWNMDSTSVLNQCYHSGLLILFWPPKHWRATLHKCSYKQKYKTDYSAQHDNRQCRVCVCVCVWCVCAKTHKNSLFISLFLSHTNAHTPFPLQSPSGTLHPHNFRCPFSRVHKKGKLFLSLLHDLASFLPLPLPHPRFPSFHSQLHNPPLHTLPDDTGISDFFLFIFF